MMIERNELGELLKPEIITPSNVYLYIHLKGLRKTVKYFIKHRWSA